MSSLIHFLVVLVVLVQFKYSASQATCSATGDPHYRTFDGKTYDFMGDCEYVLAKDIGNTFEILTKNQICNGPYSCVVSVSVNVKGFKIRMAKGSHSVTVFGIAVNLPYTNKGVTITKVGSETRIKSDAGFSIRYDGVYNLFVTVFGRHRGQMRGLCGNFNGNQNDDFIKQDGSPTTNPVEFGSSWKVDQSCSTDPPPPSPCLNAGSIAQEAKTKCALLRNQPFSQCHGTVSVDGFIKACEYDVCACKKHPLSCLCEQYAAYASTCKIVGVNVAWKHLPNFHQCSSPCASNPCLNDGVCSKTGANSFKCTCSKGFTGSRCETEDQGTCSAWGDPHYRSFDGKRYDFMGVCRYVLTKDKDNQFMVVANNVRCNGQAYSCVDTVIALVKGIKIVIGRGGTVTVFGFVPSLPYKHRGVEIIKLGRTVKISTDIGFTVQFDGVNNVFITVFGRHQGNMLGLCGNYNGDANDDFTTQDGRVTNLLEFANSWRVDRHKKCPGTQISSKPCENAGSVAQEAKKRCALLRQSPFSQCHNKVKLDNDIISGCEFDVCACGTNAESCLCEDYAEYASLCENAGARIKWRHLPAFQYCSSPCAANPCKHGGRCTNKGSKEFTCSCSAGYSGTTCEIENCKDPKPLGVESGKITDNQITASSMWRSNYGPSNGRLNFKAGGGKTGAWSARRNDAKQWIQYDFEYEATVAKILTQGRSDSGQWIKTFTVSYSNDGVNFENYQQGGVPKVFYANKDRNTVVTQTLPQAIVARFVRIHPKTWHGHISMRAGFRGCFIDQPCADEPCQNGGKCKEVDNDYVCTCLPGYYGDRCQTSECTYGSDLGMENGEILNYQIQASSVWNSNHGAQNGRLNFKPSPGQSGSWCARRNDAQQWLQIDFELQTTVKEILTQGRSNYNQWVKSYTVSYSRDGVYFQKYRVNGVVKVFPGNSDRNTVVRNAVSPVIVTRFIRIHPKTWANHISMRAEFVGCIKEWPCDYEPCLNDGTCVEYLTGYLCSCKKGFIGKNCETKEDDCKNNV